MKYLMTSLSLLSEKDPIFFKDVPEAFLPSFLRARARRPLSPFSFHVLSRFY
jgi:hypothetical protein